MTPTHKGNYPASFLTSNIFVGLHPLHDSLKEIFNLACRSAKASPQIRLLDLPLELIVAILFELDWYEILTVRKTCKALQYASKERPIWLKLFNHQVLAVLRDFKLDYPIEFYTSQELERYTLRFIGSDMVWTTDKMNPSVGTRQIPCEENGHFYLSESGRWLLVLSESGRVDYYDLDNPSLPARLLIPGLSTPYKRGYMVVDVDSEEAMLTFNLALFTGYGVDLVPVFQIWRVQLNMNPLDNQPYLSATKKASFPQGTPGHYSDMSLLGDKFAYSISNGGASGCPAYVAVVDWKAVFPTPDLDIEGLDYPKCIIYPAKASLRPRVRLLPHGRLFVLSEKWAHLFHYNDVQKTTEFIWQELRFDQFTPSRWQESDVKGYYPQTLSSAFIFRSSNTIRFIATGHHRVVGFIIPVSPTDVGTHPQIVMLINPLKNNVIKDHASASFGPHKGMARDMTINGARALAINYSWPDEEAKADSGSAWGKNVIAPPALIWPTCTIAFNEFTGRGLVFAGYACNFLIFDLGLTA